MLWGSGRSTNWCSGQWRWSRPFASVMCTRIRRLAWCFTAVKLGLKWSTQQSVLPLVCDSVLQSFDHTTCACGNMVAVNGQHGLSCRHGSGRNSRHNQEMKCCVVNSTPPVHMQHERHTRSVAAMTKNRMERHRFRGVGAIVRLGRYLPQHIRTVVCASQRQAGQFGSSRSGTEETAEVPWHLFGSWHHFRRHRDIWCTGSTSNGTCLRDRTYYLPKSVMNHGRHLFCVSECWWQLNAEMLPVSMEHCTRTVLRLNMQLRSVRLHLI